MNIEDICQRLHSVWDSPSIENIEDALVRADKEVAVLFANMNANDAFAFRDARKGAQTRLNRLRGARDRA